jgi:O-antigen/teichoic acid export membrane protein
MAENKAGTVQDPGMGLRKKMLINTLSNYGKMVISIFITIFLTRILFLGLSREEYGFWALLWSIFGYSLLLDFGFGTAIQKHTSECNVTKDWEHYNRVVSTVFFTYAMFSLFIVLFALVLSFNLQHVFDFDAANTAYFKQVTILFGLGSALCFPFGFFTEILRGLQKMHSRNIIQTIFIVLNFVGMAVMVHLKINLTGMVFVALGTNLLSSLTMMYVVRKLIPQFRLSFHFYDKSLLRSVMGFSLFAYLITFTNLIILKTDQLVISIFGSVAMVAIYQISIRLADTYQRFSAQFLDNLGPVSATLFAAGNKSKMAEIMLQSNRLMGLISSMLLIPLLVYVKPLLNIWLNLDHTAGMICAVILLISMYVLLFLRSSSVYVLLMANEHKILSVIAVIEAVLNLGLSILLIHYLPSILESMGIFISDSAIIGVALGTFIPNLILALFFNVPKACKFANIKLNEYFQTVISPTLRISFLSLVVSLLLYLIKYPTGLLNVGFYMIISVLSFILFTWFMGLKSWERKQATEFIKKHLPYKR